MRAGRGNEKMTTSGKQKKSDAGLATGAAGPKDRMTVAQFEALPVEDKIRLVRSVAGTLDPGCADYQDMADTVVVEQDSALSGGLPIAYFFRDPAHLAAARWDARQERIGRTEPLFKGRPRSIPCETADRKNRATFQGKASQHPL